MTHWSAKEDAIIRQHFADGGKTACEPLLRGRSGGAIEQRAHKLGLKKKHRVDAIVVPEGFDETLRQFYQNGNGKKRGECNAFADRMKVPRWWCSKRAAKLGLVMPHKKEPPWSPIEDALMREVPLHNPDKCSDIFRARGFPRSPTAIVVRAKRLDISRRFNEGLSATQAAEILGIDTKNFGAMCARGEVAARRLNDKRKEQQGGHRWIIQPLDLRRFVLANLERIDLRKVEKFAFIQLVSGQPLERSTRDSTRRAA